MDLHNAEEALQSAFPPTPVDSQDPLADELDTAALRKWKAEQANQALWNFGSRVRQVQQDYRHLEEISQAPKRRRVTPSYTYSGPLLLLNQYYWEKHLGSSINSIQGDNMFGINMFGSTSTICAALRRNASLAINNNNNPHSSSSCTSNSHSNSSTPGSPTDHSAVAATAQGTPGLQAPAAAPASSDSSECGSATEACVYEYDPREVEEVCRRQQLSHLPPHRRFSMALKIIRNAKQQQRRQQEQPDALAQAPSSSMVAVA